MRNSLQKIQKIFSDQLLSQSMDETFLENIYSGSLDEAGMRLSIYRNNVISSLTTALGDTYPVIKRLIGVDCFNAVASDFVRVYPPNHASLYFYGEHFADFIKTHHGCVHLDYLHEVARLEWSYQQAYHEFDAPIMSITDLQKVDEQYLGDVCLEAHSSVRLLSSAWPIHVIWSENLKENPDIVDLKTCGDASLLIYRDSLTVKVINLEKNTFYFLQNLIADYTIEKAWLATDESAEELGPQLGYLLGLNIFTNYKITRVDRNRES
jgi:hypothetical protein